MRFVFVLLLISVGLSATGQIAPAGWEVLKGVKFETRYVEEAAGEYFFPVVDDKLKKLIGTTVTIKGYYIPVDIEGNSIIISAFPYTSCFFCGGAGPESVAAVKVIGEIDEYYLDELLTVTGTFTVNDNDVDMLNFIIEDATILD